MGIRRMGIPKEFLLYMKSKLDFAFFIETGTYKGNSSIWALEHFKHVHTIENSQKIFLKNKDLMSKYPGITFHFGHSKELLPGIIKSINGNAIFWLDAHWSGSDTYGEQDECPVLQEIAIIKSNKQEHIILIDDARLFLAPPPLPHKVEYWPTISEIVLSLLDTGYHVVVYDDVIYAVPGSMKEFVVSYFQWQTTIKLNEGSFEQIKDGIIRIKDGLTQWLRK